MPALSTAPPILVVEGLRKSHGGQEILAGIDFAVAAGQVVAVIGPSGSGKSSLLRCLNHLDPPDAGQVLLDGEAIGVVKRRGRLVPAPRALLRRQRARIGMVFQSYNLFPHLTALENVIEAPIGVLGQSREEARMRGIEWLARVGLADKIARYPRELSGGQQQRVAIARALALSPRVMLFDEATAALDPELVDGIATLIRELAAGGMAVIVVTHEMLLAEKVADQCIFMDGGVILERGPARDVLRQPQHPRTRRFLRSMTGLVEAAAPAMKGAS